MTWAQILPHLAPGVRVICQNSRGVKYPDRIAMGERIGPDYLHLGTGTFSLRNGIHVCGERRIVAVREIPAPKPVPHGSGAREALIAALVQRRTPVIRTRT